MWRHITGVRHHRPKTVPLHERVSEFFICHCGFTEWFTQYLTQRSLEHWIRWHIYMTTVLIVQLKCFKNLKCCWFLCSSLGTSKISKVPGLVVHHDSPCAASPGWGSHPVTQWRGLTSFGVCRSRSAAWFSPVLTWSVFDEAWVSCVLFGRVVSGRLMKTQFKWESNYRVMRSTKFLPAPLLQTVCSQWQITDGGSELGQMFPDVNSSCNQLGGWESGGNYAWTGIRYLSKKVCQELQVMDALALNQPCVVMKRPHSKQIL